MPIDRLLHVFLCHASQDKLIVRALYDALKAEDWIDPWLDKAKILPGQDWRLVIEKAVEESDMVIVCLSKHAVTKEGFVQKEIRYAYDIALEKPEGIIFLVPLRLEECDVPRGLRSLQWVDYFGSDKNEHYQDLLEAMQHRARSLGIETVRRSVPSTSLRTSTPPHETPKEKEIVWGDKVTIGGIELVRVPKGQFIMGSNDYGSDEKPQHTVNIPYDYWMGRFPITNAQYSQFEKKDFDKR